MLIEVQRVWQDSRQTYGSPRVSIKLNMQGIKCSKNYIAKLMNSAGIQAKSRKKYRVTTNSSHRHRTAENLLQRQFHQSSPNMAWSGDITYIRTKEGWLYLSVILDLHSRLVVGWSLGPRLKTQLVIDSLKMALQRRKPDKGCLFHSDRGSQYAKLYSDGVLKQFKLRSSMSRKGNCWDNAPVERFFSSLKREWTGDRLYLTRKDAMADVREYIAVYYNAHRLHSTLGYQTPMQFENGLNKVSGIG